MNTLRFLKLVATIWATCLACGHTTSAAVSDLTLKNNLVQRVLRENNSVWRTVGFSRTDGTDKVETDSSEFYLKLMDGTELTIANYQAEGTPVSAKNESGPGSSITINYVPRGQLPPDAPQAITVKYFIDKKPYLRKTLTLVMRAGGAIDELQVERFKTKLPCDLGGKRAPVFIGAAWFAGLEYPGGLASRDDGLVKLAHFPGLVKKQNDRGQWIIESKIAVLGTGLKGDSLDLAFSDYIESIRVPSRKILLYNTYFDITASRCTIENLLPRVDSYNKNFVEPYGIKMDAFEIDNNYNDTLWDYNQVWIPKKEMYPDGFGPLSAELKKRGSGLGLWNSLSGFHLTLPDDYEKAIPAPPEKPTYCISAPHYNADYRQAWKRHLTEANLVCLKHDYLMMDCRGEGHGHLPDERHGAEANIDATLDLIDFEHQVKPDIYLDMMAHNILSPWWVMHAESCYSGGGDIGYDKPWPQPAPFDWALNFRDVYFYQLMRVDHLLMPMSTLTVHGITYTDNVRYGGPDATLQEWSDYVVLTWGRGVQAKYLYVEPGVLTPDYWHVLGSATRWADDNSSILKNSVMMGGDPAKGEIYGFACWNGDHGIITLRNPDVREHVIDVPFDKSVHYRGAAGKPFRGRTIYPFVEDLPTQFTSGQPGRLTLPGYSVMIFELQPGPAPHVTPLTLPAPPKGSAVVSEDHKLQIQVSLPDEEMPRCDLVLIGKGNGFDFHNLTLNGAPVAKTRWGRGSGWFLRNLDLKSLRGRQVTFTTSLEGMDAKLFRNDITVSAYLVADRPVPVPAASQEHLPWALAQNVRRQTVELLPPTKIAQAYKANRIITDEDLKSAQAAKLHCFVYGLVDEPNIPKSITLNGEKISSLPCNPPEKQLNGSNYRSSHNLWHEVIVDLASDQLKFLKAKNTVEVTQGSGKLFGTTWVITGFALAAQLADETWVETNADYTEYSSTPYGIDKTKEFINYVSSGPIELNF